MTMLQFGSIMCNAAARFTPRTIWRINSQQLLTVSSSAAPTPALASKPNKSTEILQQESKSKENQNKMTGKNTLVKIAFASLLQDSQVSDPPSESKLSLPSEIHEADTVDKLLTIAANRDISRRNALTIMSVLSTWVEKKKIPLNSFDTDPRFLKLCQQLGRKFGIAGGSQEYSNKDLTTVLGLTGDEEAAKLVSTLSLVQMVQVMSALARKRRRSTSMLRSLSYNISRNEEKLNIKQAADLLYSMAVLNFPDEVLLERATSDLIECIPQNDGCAVIGSILTSVGFLKYKNTELLEALCEWVVAKPRDLKPQYIESLVLTLAIVSYTPSNVPTLRKDLIDPLTRVDLPTSESWLNVVWATVILGLPNPDHVASVLDPAFIQKLIDLKCLTIPRALKLLNIDAAARLLIPNYKGPFLSKDLNLGDVKIEKSKDKQQYTLSILDTLTNLFPSGTCLNRNVDTGMGFVVDGECYMDDKCNPLPINQVKKDRNVTRIAIIALYYSDVCRGTDDPLGVYSLIERLLEKKGYKTLFVPYAEYRSNEKLVTRVKYMEQKIKSIIKP